MPGKKKLSPARSAAIAKAQEVRQAANAVTKPLPFKPKPKLKGSALIGLTLCWCSPGGVAARSLEAAAPPVFERKRGVPIFDADPGRLRSFIIGDGAVPASLEAQLAEFAATARRDDTMVREDGCGPAYVHLHDTQYSSCSRVSMGLCYRCKGDGTAVLASYSQNYCPSGLTSMRHMPPCVYRLGCTLWQSAYHRLPEMCRARPPNICILQTYRRSKGDFMDYHTDARESFWGQPIVQEKGSVVMTYTICSSSSWMGFYYHDYDYNKKTATRKPTQYYFPLKGGETLVWDPVDDYTKKHGVWWMPGAPKDEVRHVFVFRWTRPAKRRAYYTEYPHRPVLDKEEEREIDGLEIKTAEQNEMLDALWAADLAHEADLVAGEAERVSPVWKGRKRKKAT